MEENKTYEMENEELDLIGTEGYEGKTEESKDGFTVGALFRDGIIVGMAIYGAVKLGKKAYRWTNKKYKQFKASKDSAPIDVEATEMEEIEKE